MSQDKPFAEEGYALMGVVELKSVSALCPEHEAQLLNYMRITRNPIGYLINFGPIGKLQY